MAFDPNKYKPKGIKKLPVLLLLDVSGSMDGKKIVELHDAVVEMINSYVEMKKRERVIEVAIITFGAEVRLYTEFTPVDDLQKNGIPQFPARGNTPLGMALTAAKDLLEDPQLTPQGNYRPAVVLVSDGEPNDEWRNPLEDFISSGRSSKAQRFSVAIGVEADRAMLRLFAQDDDAMFFANNVGDLAEAFKVISSKSVSNSNVGAVKPVPTAAGTNAGQSVQPVEDEDQW